jgi:hypothetical protein
MGFCSLQHIRSRRSTFRRFACLLRSAFRVWLPSWRFTPFESLSVFFHTDGAHGIHPSETFPFGRSSGCYHPMRPTYRLAKRYSRRRSAGPAREASVPGFLPFRRSLTIGRFFRPPIAGASHGVHPSRVFQQKPWSGFRPTSSLALRKTGGNRQPHRRPRVSIGSRLVLSANRTSTKRRIKQPSLGSYTGLILHIKASDIPGYAFTSHRAKHYCPYSGAL